jgi:isopenicillin N synthase-like dioxygenase
VKEVEEAFALSRQFFAREVKDKELFAWTPDNIGYVAVQRERCVRL